MKKGGFANHPRNYGQVYIKYFPQLLLFTDHHTHIQYTHTHTHTFSPPLSKGQALCIQYKKVLFHERSKYQDVLVLESANYGNVLVLDGIIQVTQRDQHAVSIGGE